MSHQTSRRTFLALGCGAACSTLLGCDPTGHTLPASVSAGSSGAVALGTLRPVAGAPVAVGRDAGGLFALSLVCTHQGCDISSDGKVSATRIECDCHGSTFDGQGNLLKGPASRPLPHLELFVSDEGQMTVTNKVVPSSTRIAV